MNDTEKALIGATIIDAEVSGYGIKLLLDSGKTLDYESSDGGYSCWEIAEEEQR